MTGPEPMLDALRSRFELQGLAIAQLPESLEQPLIEAGKVLAAALLGEQKIIIFGQDDCIALASTLLEELTNSSNIERPPLPGLLLDGKSGNDQLQRQLCSVGKSGDVLIAIQGSRQDSAPDQQQLSQLSDLCAVAQSMNIKLILIGSSGLSILGSGDSVQIEFDYDSRMNYLCSATITTLTLISLIDSHLFGHPI